MSTCIKDDAIKDNAKKATLLERLGGQTALRAAVDEFYKRLIDDERLERFFVGVNIDRLKRHQYNFMSMAFTKVPDGFDVEKLVLTKHERLFQMGLNEGHFDIVAGHFVGTLRGMGVKRELIDEAVGVIAPLRVIFVEAAAEVEQWQAQLKKKRTLAGIAVSVAVVVLAASLMEW